MQILMRVGIVLGCTTHQQVHMVRHEFHRVYREAKFLRDIRELLPYEILNIANEDLLPVLYTPNQVVLDPIHISSTMRYICFVREIHTSHLVYIIPYVAQNSNQKRAALLTTEVTRMRRPFLQSTHPVRGGAATQP